MSDNPTGPEDVTPEDATSEDVTPDSGDTAADPATEKTGRAPNTAAAAASRARRIGGRPVVKTGATETATETAVETSAGDNLSRRERKAAAKTSTAEASSDKTSTVKTSIVKVPPGKTSTEERSGKSPAAGDDAGERSRLVWVPAAVLIAAVVAMAVFFAVARIGGGGGTSGTANRQHVLAAAKSCLVASNSYSYKSLAAFEKKGLACGTGTFAKQFTSSVDKVLDKNAAAVKQTQTFQVNYAGIVDVTAQNQWDILIYGQVNVTNVSTGKTGRVDPYGAIARMQQVHGTWRLSNLATLCSSTILQSGNKCS